MLSTLLAIVALAPAALRLLAGRRLLAALDDPALPERMQADRMRLLQAEIAAVAVLLVVSPANAWWTMPLSVAAFVAAGFPARRDVLGETWSLPAYLAWLLRLGAGGLGLWLLLAAAPTLAILAGPLAAPATALLALLLALWGELYAEGFLRLCAAERLAAPELTARLDAVDARATTAPPGRWTIGPPGWRTANAMALGSPRGSSVVFTRPLLELLDADEAGAIYAHEVAHLEHFDERFLRRRRRITRLLVAGAVAVAAAAPLLGEWGRILALAWVTVPLAVLVSFGSHRRAHEAECDRRAVALGGDGEALARALTKLHAAARLPRRWEAATEQAASHPSLVERLRAIREAAGAPPPSLAEAAAVGSTEAGRWALFEPDRISWLESVPPGAEDAAALRARAPRSRSLAYSELADLRIRAGASGTVTLVARERGGASTAMPVRAADVLALQAALEAVDGRMSGEPASRWSAAVARLVAALAAASALVALQLGAAAAALVACLRPGPATLVAGGAAGLGAAALATLRPAPPAGEMLGVLTVLVLAAAGAVAILAGLFFRAEPVEPSPPASAVAALAVLAALALGGLGAAAVRSPAALRLHEAARTRPGAAVLLLALGAALLFARGRRARAGAAAALVASAAVAAAGGERFAAALVRDPLFAVAPRLEARDAWLAVDAEAPLPAAAYELDASAGGTAFAVRLVPEGGRFGAAPTRFVAGDFLGRTATFEAEAVRPLDDGGALVLVRTAAGLELRRLAALDASAPAWTRGLPAVEGAVLEADASGRSWSVVGERMDGEQAETVAVRGGEPPAPVEIRRFPAPPPSGETGAWQTLPGAAGALRVRTLFALPSPAWLAVAQLGLFGGVVRVERSELWAADRAGERRLAVSALGADCFAPPPVGGDDEWICTTFAAGSTPIWSVPLTGERRLLGVVPGALLGANRHGRSIVAYDPAGAIVALDLDRLRLERILVVDREARPFAPVAAGASFLALGEEPPRVQRLVRIEDAGPR